MDKYVMEETKKKLRYRVVCKYCGTLFASSVLERAENDLFSHNNSAHEGQPIHAARYENTVEETFLNRIRVRLEYLWYPLPQIVSFLLLIIVGYLPFYGIYKVTGWDSVYVFSWYFTWIIVSYAMVYVWIKPAPFLRKPIFEK